MSGLVGRHAERERLLGAAELAATGQGSLVLLAGEAGVGKTRLATELASRDGLLFLRGAAVQGVATPYGPVVAALRSHLRTVPDALADCGRLRSHLALVLPELGRRAGKSDRPTLFEAFGEALAHLSRERPVVLVLDDLHWSDAATLELLGGLAEPLRERSVLVVASYRSDGLPRDHGLRKLRHDLRRGGLLDEIVLEPLSVAETAELLEVELGRRAAPALIRTVHDRTQGVPFVVEELARALATSGALRESARGLEPAADGKLPLPDTVRDAVLLGLADLSDAGRATLDAAAVAGVVFDLALVAEIAGDAGLEAALASGLIIEGEDGRACFRHALSRDAVYADIPWGRRRALHRSIATALEAARAPAAEIAAHWNGARDGARARAALVAAAAEFECVHAYRDAAEAGRQALELWPEGEGEGEPARVDALERYAGCSERAGDLSEATRAWREICDIRGARGEGELLARAERRLAGAYDMKGERELAFAARRVAAEAFAANGLPGDAAIDHLAMSNQLRLGGKFVAAVEFARLAHDEAEAAGRLDLRLRAQGLEGVARAKGDDPDEGLRMVRDGLAQAVEHELSAVAAELYQRLSLVLYDVADYGTAQAALETALDLCRVAGGNALKEACVSCLAYVLRDRGEWDEAAAICKDLIAVESTAFVGEGLMGSIHAYQGRLTSARRLLSSSLAVASRIGHYNMTIDSTTALAFVAAAEGNADEAAEHCRALLARWEQSDDHHYALSGLRWAAVWFTCRGDRDSAHECTNALTRIAAASAHAEALAAVAHATGELALLDGDADTAASQLTAALDLHAGLDMAYVRAQIELRCGVALGEAGERDAAIDRLVASYRTARKLGARPLAADAAREVAALGESVAGRVGQRGEADAEGGGLSRREREVVRLLAVGRTNREIAQQLFLSPRTVDMHVRNILRKLDSRSRIEAANRAGELGLLAEAGKI